MNTCITATAEQKGRARALVAEAIRDGKLTRVHACSSCQLVAAVNGAVVAHHEDYDKPLDVVWLCWSCHAKRHRAIRRAAGIDQGARHSERMKAWWAENGDRHRTWLRRLREIRVAAKRAA